MTELEYYKIMANYHGYSLECGEGLDKYTAFVVDHNRGRQVRIYKNLRQVIEAIQTLNKERDYVTCEKCGAEYLWCLDCPACGPVCVLTDKR